MPSTIVLVSGNKGKLAEWQRLAPVKLDLTLQDLDIAEIQSADLEEIAIDKARRAYEIIKQPVIVEDVAAGLDRLGGLPGQFVKYFEKTLGYDALYKLANDESEPGTAICTIAYFDGKNTIVVQGKVHGKIVRPRGAGGWGFDKCFQPNGQSKTYGEMTPLEKDKFSHRAKAIPLLVKELDGLMA